MVEPRLGARRPADYLLGRAARTPSIPGGAWSPSRTTPSSTPPARAGRPIWSIVATGAAFDHLAGTERLAARLRRVRLQMLETEPFAGSLTTALADADTLRYYPAYEVVPHDLLGPQAPVAAAHHLQLLLVQRADGGLTIGDTHAYDEPFDFALAEDPSIELLARAEACSGRRCLRSPGAGRVSMPSAPTVPSAPARS